MEATNTALENNEIKDNKVDICDEGTDTTMEGKNYVHTGGIGQDCQLYEI